MDGPNGVGDKQGEAGVLATRGKRAPWLGVSTGEGATTSGSRGGGVGGGTAAAAAAVGVDPTYEESGGSVGRGLQGVSLPVAAAETPVASTCASPSTSSDGNTVSRGGNRGDKERGGPDNTGCPAPPPCSRLPIRCPWIHKSNLFTSPCCRDAGAAGGNGGPSESCEKHTDVGFPHSPRPVLSPSEPCDQPTVYNNARSAEDRSMRQTPPARTPTSTKGSRHRPRGKHSAPPRHAHHPRAARPHLTPAKGAHCQCQLRQKEAARSSIRQGEPRGAAAQRGALWGERGKSRDTSHPAAVQTRPSGTRGSSRRRARNRPMYQGTGHTEQ